MTLQRRGTRKPKIRLINLCFRLIPSRSFASTVTPKSRRIDSSPRETSSSHGIDCFLTGICSGCICVIVAAAWTPTVYKPFTATISLLAFFIGYLMTRISMALPHACVGCYYTCYAENPGNRFFVDKLIKERQTLIKNGRVAVTTSTTPRVRRAFA